VSDLDGRDVEMVKHDLAKDRPSRELLERLIDEYGLGTVMSTKSPTWKKMGLDLATMTKKKAIDLMLEEPNLIKRPLVLVKGKAIFGFKPDQYDELLG
jgi:Spx/MgsR family transcriptional regulator